MAGSGDAGWTVEALAGGGDAEVSGWTDRAAETRDSGRNRACEGDSMTLDGLLFTTETPYGLWRAAETLYGLWRAAETPSDTGRSVVCGGDAGRMSRHGL